MIIVGGYFSVAIADILQSFFVNLLCIVFFLNFVGKFYYN
jgi:hypothetical protein